LDDSGTGSTVNASTVGTYYNFSSDIRSSNKGFERILARSASTSEPVYKVTVFKHSTNGTSEQAHVIIEVYYP